MALPADVAAELEVMLLSESSRCPLVYIVAEVLAAVAVKGDRKAELAGDREPTSYDSAHPPAITVRDYVQRWARYTRCGAVVCIVAVLYVDRVCVRTGLVACTENIHRLLLPALLLASKWHADVPFLNKYYAKVGGVALKELNRLEQQLLSDLDFGLNVTPEQLSVYTSMFRRHYKWPEAVAAQQGMESPEPMQARRAPSPPALPTVRRNTVPGVTPAQRAPEAGAHQSRRATAPDALAPRSGAVVSLAPLVPAPPAGGRPHRASRHSLDVSQSPEL